MNSILNGTISTKHVLILRSPLYSMGKAKSQQKGHHPKVRPVPVRKHVATGKPRGRVPKGDQDGPELSSEELSLFNDYVARQSNYGEKCQHHFYTNYLEQLRDGEVKKRRTACDGGGTEGFRATTSAQKASVTCTTICRCPWRFLAAFH